MKISAVLHSPLMPIFFGKYVRFNSILPTWPPIQQLCYIPFFILIPPCGHRSQHLPTESHPPSPTYRKGRDVVSTRSKKQRPKQPNIVFSFASDQCTLTFTHKWNIERTFNFSSKFKWVFHHKFLLQRWQNIVNYIHVLIVIQINLSVKDHENSQFLRAK